MKLDDLTGMPFGRLTVLRKAVHPTAKGKSYWECKCKCGNVVTVRKDHLINHRIQSCGCLARDVNSKIHSIDLTGKKFGRLTVLGLSEKKGSHGEKLWKCECSCEDHTIIEVITSNPTRGNTTSCGCYHRERTSEPHLKWKTPDEQRISTIYDTMVQRCTNPNHTQFEYWGGRGIYICDEWRNNKASFVEWAKSNGYRPGLTIDRIDVDGPYAPWNCRWADEITQANNKRNNFIIVVDGVSHTLAEWARLANVNYDHLKYLKNTDLDKAIAYIKSNLNYVNLFAHGGTSNEQ